MISKINAASFAVVALAVAAAGCSSDSSNSIAPVTDSVAVAGSLPEPTDPNITIAVEPLPVVTVKPAKSSSSVPTNSSKPKDSTSSTKPSKGGETTSTTAPVKDKWKDVDPSSAPGPLALPCCAENFHGTPSPELPSGGADLADGTYFAEGPFRKIASRPLRLKIYRLEACSKIPTKCEDFGDDATAMGIDRSASFDLTLPLDKSVAVYFTGFKRGDSATVAGTGADLAKLATALHDSYDKLIGSRIAKGQKPEKVLNDVATHPSDGWQPAEDQAGVLTFTFGSAPPVLLQAIPESGNGADLIGVIALHVEGGKMTLLTFGGYYS